MPRTKNSANYGFAAFLILFSAVVSPTAIQAQAPRVKVSIVANGKVMTDQPMTILAGQAVNLSFTPSGGPVVYPSWQVSWTGVTDYNPTLQSGKVTPVDIYQLKQNTVKFHWIDQGQKQVTLLFYLSSGCVEGPANCVRQGSVTAYFNVIEPTNVKVTAVTNGTITTETGVLRVTGKVVCFDGGTKVGLADGATSAGIGFTAAADMPNGSNGTFLWVQLINYDNYRYFGSNGILLGTESHNGLDVNPRTPKTYIYGVGMYMDDSPDMGVYSGTAVTQVSRAFSATAYLMWVADPAADTIPVPVGTISWSTGWTVTFNPKSTDPCKWTISQPSLIPGAFGLNVHYPIWNGVSLPPTAQ